MPFDALYNHYLPFVEELSSIYNYDSNVTHLLKILIPLFAMKYEISNEKMILDVFKKVPIVFEDSFNSDDVNALYLSRPVRRNGEITLIQQIIINGRKDNLLYLSFLENMVHEYLHAFNSYRNSHHADNTFLCLRTGLSNSVFDKDTLKFIKHDSSLLLEEVLNTKESEKLIQLLLEQNSTLADVSIVLSSMKQEINGDFHALGYRLPLLLVEKLITNSSFYHQALFYRLNGEIENFGMWFDSITNVDGSYKKFNQLLTKIVDLISNLEHVSFLLRGKNNRDIKKNLVLLNDIINLYLNHSITG